MSEESKNLLHLYHNKKTEKEINNALAWAQQYEFDFSKNRIKSPYTIARLVYLFQTANKYPNSIGKALCEVFNVFDEDETKDFLNSFRFPTDSIYRVFKYWMRTREIPVIFVVKLLCEAYNIMHIATLEDDLDMVHWLLKLNIDVDKQDSEGMTAIHIAAATGKGQIIRCLLHFEASLFSLDKQHHTPLEVALYHERFEVVELLMPRLFCNLRMNDGETLFMRLIRQDQVSQVRHMIRYADFSVLNLSKQNVLHVCALSGHAKVIGILLNETPSGMINDKDVSNQTPLSLAVCKNKYRMVGQLLAAGAEITPEIIGLNKSSDINDLLKYKNCKCLNQFTNTN